MIVGMPLLELSFLPSFVWAIVLIRASSNNKPLFTILYGIFLFLFCGLVMVARETWALNLKEVSEHDLFLYWLRIWQRIWIEWLAKSGVNQYFWIVISTFGFVLPTLLILTGLKRRNQQSRIPFAIRTVTVIILGIQALLVGYFVYGLYSDLRGQQGGMGIFAAAKYFPAIIVGVPLLEFILLPSVVWAIVLSRPSPKNKPVNIENVEKGDPNVLSAK